MMKKIVIGIVAFFVFLAVFAGGYLYSVSVTLPEEAAAVTTTLHDAQFTSAAAVAEDWLLSLYSANKLPSLSAAVGIGGKLVWSGVIGHADLDTEIPAEYHTTYRIGSISKSLTAAAAMRLREQGLLDLDKPYSAYVKDRSADSSFTIQQLLSHQAGIRHYREFSENISNVVYADTRAAAAIVENDALLFTPGTGFSYSTYGYNLLAFALESAAAQPFEEVMSNEVFRAVGMTATQFEKVDVKEAKSNAEPYVQLGEILIEAPEVNLSDRYAGGGFVSTPSDLVKFGNALLGTEFLSSESKNILWAPVPLADGTMNAQNYALGFRVGEDEQGRLVHHGGTSIGGYSFLVIYPETGIVVAFSTNISLMDPAFDRMAEAKNLVKAFTPNL